MFTLVVTLVVVGVAIVGTLVVVLADADKPATETVPPHRGGDGDAAGGDPGEPPLGETDPGGEAAEHGAGPWGVADTEVLAAATSLTGTASGPPGWPHHQDPHPTGPPEPESEPEESEPAPTVVTVGEPAPGSPGPRRESGAAHPAGPARPAPGGSSVSTQVVEPAAPAPVRIRVERVSHWQRMRSGALLVVVLSVIGLIVALGVALLVTAIAVAMRGAVT